ncbi:hypothetical protein [Tenacibaculum mesophilum]|uniref:hypothetical protein n=1 Tax=Tenacibaculum mesophilum TaxID=104268 RepID=UPI00064B4EB7|nr:hypothetical protein [Tenacibaculum mesophilum]
MTKEKERTYKGIASFDSGKGNTMEITFPKVRPALKFIANLRRLDSYKGEFGFDWMRDDYQTICKDYEKLKKEYTPTKIHDKDYFVPWLSMFPQQQNVKLKLEVEILEGKARDIDVIKLPKKEGIRFEPEQVKVNEVESKQIKIICNSPLSNDVTIDLLDKNDKKVGAINVVRNANHEQLHFNIIPVRILRSVSKQTDIDIIEKQIDIEGVITKNGVKEKIKGWGNKGTDLTEDLKNLENYLNKNSLNQALLQCNIGKVYDLIIDEDKWIDDNLIIDEGCIFKDTEILEKLHDEFKSQHPIQAKKRGLVLFLSPLRKGGAGGEGEISEIDAKRFVIYHSNLWDKTSFSHEISHVLGLTHSFQKKADKNKVFEYNKYIKEIDDYFNSLIKKGTSKSEIAREWANYKEGYKVIRSYLNTYYRNPYIFEKTKTENIMDYSNVRKSFWRYQWKAMQDDMIKFYNKR